MNENVPEPNEPRGNPHRPHVFHIQIDREHYEVNQPEMTGTQLRNVPPTPIPADRDLFEVVPGHADLKIENETVVKIRDGARFFTAPGHINPGSAIS
jgi:Multiubiquitin